MAQLTALLRLFEKCNKNISNINLRNCRFYSLDPRTRSFRSSSVYWTIHGTDSSYSSANAILHFSQTKVAFNCGEGYQRLVAEENGKILTSIEQLFITKLDWRCLSGLHDIILSRHIPGTKDLDVYGPSTLRFLSNRIMTDFSRRKHVGIVDCDNGHTYTDQAFSIRAIPLRNASEKHPKVIAYVGDVKAYQSRIKIEKCVDLNVPAGPLITQLAKGLDVTLDDGSVVRSADVIDSFPKLNFLGKIRSEIPLVGTCELMILYFSCWHPFRRIHASPEKSRDSIEWRGNRKFRSPFSATGNNCIE